jgi:pimeloyl-ACP methyl ester carboxylesterase
MVDVGGVELAAYEWGAESGPPLFLVHGGLDFAATFDLLAPVLADAGYRVISWDQRGHGDSGHAALSSWDVDVRDALTTITSVTTGPVPIVGHSKGGGLTMQLADAYRTGSADW